MAKNLSTFAIAQMLHVDPGSVANWIDQERLKAFRTPGGHRRVAAADLIRFLKDHNMPVPPELRSAPARILIIDPEPTVTRTIAAAIAAAHGDYEVVEAHDGFRAGALVATLKPDVVLLDLQMPGVDSYEVCRLIKSQYDTQHVKILAMSGFPSPDYDKRIVECGASKCLRKPIDASELVREIDAAL